MISPFPNARDEKRKVLLEAVQSISDVVAANADRAEELRTLPKDTVDALYNSGLLKLKLPTELGGAEADPVTMIEVIEAMTYVDTSAGWGMMIAAVSASMAAAFLPDETIKEIFTVEPSPKFTVSVAPPGTATRQKDGYIVNGRWAFASGVLHSDWMMGLAAVRNGEGSTPEFRTVVMPKTRVQIHDNWHVAGLQGTGSCDVSVSDLFVSDTFTWGTNDLPRRGGPIYRIARPGYLTESHIGFALGVARRALDEVIETAKTKRRGGSPSPLAERSYFQLRVGECDLKLRAAASLAKEVHEKAWKTVCADEPLSLSQQVDMRASATYVTEVAREVVTKSFQFAGASALHNSNVLQRCYRDMAAAAQHRLMDNVSYELWGKLALGISDVDPLS